MAALCSELSSKRYVAFSSLLSALRTQRKRRALTYITMIVSLILHLIAV